MEDGLTIGSCVLATTSPWHSEHLSLQASSTWSPFSVINGFETGFGVFATSNYVCSSHSSTNSPASIIYLEIMHLPTCFSFFSGIFLTYPITRKCITWSQLIWLFYLSLLPMHNIKNILAPASLTPPLKHCPWLQQHLYAVFPATRQVNFYWVY